MVEKKHIRISYLKDLFLIKYFKDDFESNSIDHGKVREFVGVTNLDKIFFDEYNTDNALNFDDFQTFKTMLYGTGRYKFRFNEDIYNSINHNNIKTIEDVFNLLSSKKVSVSFLRDNENLSVVFSDISDFIQFYVFKIIVNHSFQIINKVKKMKNDTTSKSIIRDYYFDIIFSAQKQFENSYQTISENIANEISKDFRNKATIYVQKNLMSTTYIFTNDLIKYNLDLNDFFDKVIFLEKNHADNLIDYIETKQDYIKNVLELEFSNIVEINKKDFEKMLSRKRLKGAKNEK